jgi:clan AA aspartic protease
MISGMVNPDREAVVRLVVFGTKRRRRTLNAIIDSGFSGDLTLPSKIITSLGFRWLGREAGVLADGSTNLFDVYSGEVIWDGQRRRIEIEEADTDPLVGMQLLDGHLLQIAVVSGGTVTISPLP